MWRRHRNVGESGGRQHLRKLVVFLPEGCITMLDGKHIRLSVHVRRGRYVDFEARKNTSGDREELLGSLHIRGGRCLPRHLVFSMLDIRVFSIWNILVYPILDNYNFPI